ncbi:hypothetical protein CJ030_MR2G006268 [Morella rubra]|uniref:DUF7722 domain-containing protein n=1 Tax=Morella rubra TaxID=262757 RepID=A0A6A1W8V5_9ROSI|nr:hypothetical protein CJ030_MR2G006262 [Morella rubra]KAB1221695.1 hypothetical protein CJ030_MR2G006268 [Morella rubra]
MALSWLLHSVCHVLGSPKDTNMQCNPHVERVQGDHVNSLKVPNGGLPAETQTAKETCHTGFQMPLHYPRCKKADYEKMEEWKVDLLLLQYGLDFKGALAEKRAFAMGAFLWPDQY